MSPKKPKSNETAGTPEPAEENKSKRKTAAKPTVKKAVAPKAKSPVKAKKPVAEAPKAEAPKAEAPVEKAPEAETPVVKPEPKTEAPAPKPAPVPAAAAPKKPMTLQEQLKEINRKKAERAAIIAKQDAEKAKIVAAEQARRAAIEAAAAAVVAKKAAEDAARAAAETAAKAAAEAAKIAELAAKAAAASPKLTAPAPVAKPAVPPVVAKPAAAGAASAAAPVAPVKPTAPGQPPSQAMPGHKPSAEEYRPKNEPRKGPSFRPGTPHSPTARPAAPAVPVKPAAAPVASKPELPTVEKSATELKKIKVSVQGTVRELAEKMGIKPVDFIKKLMSLGIFATITQRLDPDIATLIAADYGCDLEIVPMYGEEQLPDEEEADKPETLKQRPPIVTIMGHVDHGKTTLLDALRESNVVDTESGQITQHIGAYMVHTPKGMITILDTPGHAAFTAMRAHGAKITDIVILVVSAVDGVMPQTLEAINHAKAGGVPMIVAINKMDLPTANPQNIKQQLANNGLLPEDWGGKVPMVEISARKRENLDKLLEIVAIQAELMELKANPDKPGSGIVIEAELDSKRGIVTTVVVMGGTIKVGDPFVVGTAHGKVRALIDDKGKRLDQIGPSMPAALLGISGDVPHAGDIIKIAESDKDARHIADKRKINKREESLIHQKHVSLVSLKSQVEQHLLKTLNVVLKTDVFGSLQAIKDSLEKLSTQEVSIHILHAGIGNVTESDVLLAKASEAIIFGFHVDMEGKVEDEAKKSGVEVRSYKIIYDLLEDVRAAMSGLLEPEIVEIVTGRAEIGQIFDLSSGKVAGSIIKEGKIVRNQQARIMRGKTEVGKAKISGLKRFKEDVRDVEKGLECGILLDGFKDFQPGDIVEAITKEERVRRISSNE